MSTANLFSTPSATQVLANAGQSNPNVANKFLPRAPETLSEAGLSETDVESLILKAMFVAGAATGRTLADQLRLPGPLVRAALDRLRVELLVTHRGTADLVDFVFQLTETGSQRAKQYAMNNTYCGAAPVPLDQYVRSVQAQTIRNRALNFEKFRNAMAGIYLSRSSVNELAQAVNAGRGMFLFGAAGNGKTTVAERLARSFEDYLWIPRSIAVGGEIIRLLDSSVHQEIEPERFSADVNLDFVDRRWALIERPTIVVGGELVMETLEIGKKDGTTVLEAPVQMKSNGGVLVIDDFGRQRVSPTDILNRWIVPLDRGRDYLSLPNGRQITVPFDQILVMATNLEPKELVDEAFLRRIPFKIRMPDPNQKAFTDVFLAVARSMKIEASEEDVKRLFQRHYAPMKIEPRFCQPRDLLFHVANICALHGMPRKVTDDTMDLAVMNYFMGMYGYQHAEGADSSD